ncbi:MAG: tandem-95 repeat protein [Novosphingobium sp.]|nr:tandem-95 repeat protein [Novosphingobium sp.]
MDFQDIRNDGQDTARGDTPLVNDDLVFQSGAGQPVVINAFANDVLGAQSASFDPASGARLTFTQPEQGVVTFDPGSGLFTFVPVPGQQGPVQFTYTVIDADGDAATATVVITLAPGGIPGSSVITAAANGTAVPDADNVVVLPPGVTLDDVTARGRDLVIRLPDGTLQVIADGAINVPQLVIDGVAVPPSNFAALLIGGEAIGTNQPIEPAAGPARSSGSNFFEAARPIQRAFDIGDLLPPTAFNLAVEPREEVIPQPIDREPSNLVITPDQPAGSSNATASVSEAGLPARGAEPAGSNAASNSETTTGTILFSAPDGLASMTINGATFSAIGQTFVTPRGILTITSFDAAAGTAGFSFTLTDNLLGSTVAEVFTIVTTDRDGDSATSTLTINVADDAPTARNDTDALGAGVFTAQTGNVITAAGTTSGAAGADTVGADNAAITRIASNNVTANVDTSFDAAGNLQVAGQYGTLLIRADGSYSYTRAAGTPGGVSDAFTYTLTDSDGSASTATLTIAIADAAPAITLIPTTGPGTVVAEAGLPPRGSEAPGSNAPAPSETTSGTITFTGGDAPVTVTINGTTIVVGTVITTPSGTLTVTSLDPVAGTIGYTFTLADNTAGDTTSVSFTLVVTDVDGDSASGTLVIAITDDVPLAVNDSATQATENAPVTVNVLGNDVQGADSVAFSAVAAVSGTLSGTGTLVYNNDGSFTYTPGAGEQGTVTFDYTITDGDGDASRATVTITLLADSIPTVSVAGDNTVSEAALPARGAEPAGSNAASPDETAVGTIPITTGGDTLASLVINGVDVTAGGTVTTAKGVLTVSVANGAYSYSYTLTDNTLVDPDSDTFTVTVTDSDGDTASTSLVIAIADDVPLANADVDSVTEDGPLAATGNVISTIDVTEGPDANATDGVLDVQGADGARVSAVAFLPGAGDPVSGTVGAGLAGAYGSLTLNADGSYRYALDNAHPLVQGLDGNDTLIETFRYTLTDGDGDTSTTTLTVTINGSDDPVTISGLNVAGGEETVREDDLLDGSSPDNAALTQTGTFTVNGVDGITTIVVDGVVVFGPGAVVLPGQTFNAPFGTLTIVSVTPTATDANGDVTAATIAYSYKLNDNTLTHTAAGNDPITDSFAVSVTDTDGSVATASLDVVVIDDVPTARADGTFDVAEQTPLVISALANDTFGADGGSLSAGVAITTQPTKGTVSYSATTGQFTYTPNAGAEGADSFQYTITDGDGDMSTATVTLNLLADSVPVVKSTTPLAIDEDGLAGANADDGQTDPAEIAGTDSRFDTSGVAVVNFGADTPADPLGAIALVDSAGLDTQLRTLDGNFVTFALEAGVLIGRAAVGGAEVIRVAITGATVGMNGDVTYTYSTTLSQPVKHATAGTEDTVTLMGVTFQVTDSDGDMLAIPGSFNVTVRDDVPSASNEAGGSLAEGATVTGTLDFVPGADGAGVTAINGTALTFGMDGSSQGVTLFSAGATAVGTIRVKADGSYSFTAANPLNNPIDAVGTFTVTDRDGDAVTANIAFTIVDANAPTGGAASAAVDDDGLMGGNLASNIDDLDANLGDAPADTSEASFTGTLTFTPGGDIPTTITFASTVNGSFAQVGLERVQYEVVGNLLTAKVAATTAGGIAQTRAGASLFTVEITSVTAGTYKVTLLDNVLHAGGPNQEATDALATIGFTVTDSDSSTAAATLGITFDDDAPTANTIAVMQATENQAFTISIVGNFAAGADGVDLAGVTFTNPAQGTLTYANGVFTYTPISGAGSNGNLTDNFTYSVTDADGDTATATITITLQPDSTPLALDVTAKLDDDGLPAGNPASNDGDDLQNTGEIGAGTASEAVWTGTLGVSAGTADAPLSYSLASAAGSGMVGTENVTFTWSAATNTLTATVAAMQARAGTVLFTVKIDDVNTGAYTITLINPIAHATLNSMAGDDTENNASVVLTYTVTDADTPTGDADTGLITIDFDDDTPSASSFSVTQPDENQAFAIPLAGQFDAGADLLASITFTNPGQGTLVLNGTTFTYTPIAGAGSTGTADSFSYTITDRDGDSVTRTVSITLQPDSTPMVRTTTNLEVDEDGLMGANVDNDQMTPTETDGTESATATGTAVFSFGNDVPLVAGSAVLVDTPALDLQLVTLSGQNVVFALEMGALVGRAGDAMGVEVIRIILGTPTAGMVAGDVNYPYTVTLSQPVRHATAGTEDTDILAGVTIQVTDRDGDMTTGSFNVTVRDDVPSLNVAKGDEAAVTLTTQDAGTAGNLSDTATTMANFAGVFSLSSVAGADGAVAPVLSFALNVTSSVSGLFSNGVAINLYKLGDGTIVGSTDTTPAMLDPALTVFSLAVSNLGVVTLTQFQQIDHPIVTDPDTTDTTFDDHIASLADGLITLTASSSITDGDGDVATDNEMVNIGANIRFADDGPALGAIAAGAGVSIDETAAGANFTTSPIMASSMGAVITATSAFGADGPFGNNAATATTYGLTITSAMGATSLKTAIGDFAITLVSTAANVIEGRYIDALMATQVAFRLTIDADGKLIVQQFVALEHLDDGNTAGQYDDALNLAGLVNATITIKDFDGDTASANQAIGGNIVFRDDGVDAKNDADSIAAGTNGPALGNVLTGDGTNAGTANADYRGADGSFVTSVTGAMGATTIAATGPTEVQGSFGVLTISADGTYSYARTPGLGGGSDDVFTYTLTDNDGDFDTATLTIAIGDLIPVATTASATVDDEGLGGIPGGAGDIDANAGDGDTTSEAIFKGTLGGTLGDGTNTFLFGAALNNTTAMIGQETVTYTVSTDGSLLTATITMSPDATRLTTTLFTVRIDNQTTGAYTLTLVDNVLHPTLDGMAGDDTENDVDITVAYQLRDQDLDLSTAGVLSIKFDDDIPTANAFSVTQTTENAAFTIPLAGQFAAGADGLAATGGITFTSGAQGTVTLVGTTLTYTPIVGAGSPPLGTADSFTYTITDADGDAVTRTVSVTLQPDSVPTLSVTDVTVDEKGLPKGSGEFADGNSANNSDTSETSTGTFTITTGGDTVQAVEVQAANGMWINVTAATVGSPVIVTGANGTLTVTSNGLGSYSYSYTLTQNLANHTVQGAGDTLPGDSFAVRVTDSDNDQTTVTAATTINVTVIDDAPVVYAKDSPILIANSGGVSQTGNFDFTVGADQRTSYSASNSDFGTIVLTGTVGGTQTITPTNLVADPLNPETATSATFLFSFTYTASGNPVTANGKLIFDKVLGSYTIDLDAPIQASVSPPSVSGSTSIVGYASGTNTVDNSQPDVSVARITSQLFVQFTGNSEPGGGTGANNLMANSPTDAASPTTYTAGDLFTQARDFVSISGSANGVGGDTLSQGEVLDMDFFIADPKGFDTLTPTAQVSTIFFKFDGIGASEDFIIILKTYDTVTMQYSTRALYVANNDIFKGTPPAGYEGITLDNNDGLIVIEPNDYKFGMADANIVIVGAQITTTNEGITGPAISFNGLIGMGGASAPGGDLSDDVNDTAPLKISDIGFLTTTTSLQNASLNFTFQLKDSEGDLSATQVLTANVVNSTTPVALDLDGGGVQFQGLDAGTTFNYGDDGSRVASAWVGKGDGLLAIDLNANGQVDSGKEIVFSTGSLTDLEGLAAKHDSNKDGVLDARDANFAKFGVWQDADGDGVSDAGEFRSLADLGIVSIKLTSDGIAYTAANGDVTVAGSSTFTRADGTTGTVADAAFATAPLDRMAAKTAELTATNVAAAGVLAAAAAAAALPVAAAETAAATGDGLDAPATLSLQAMPETHATLRPAGDALASEPARQAPAETANQGGEDAPAAASNLAASADQAAASIALEPGNGHSAAFDNAFAAGGSAGDAGQLMDALLAAAQAANAGVTDAGQHAQDLAAVQEAFGDSHGAALVDAVVAHFAGADAAVLANGADALASLLAASVGGGEGFGPQFDLNQMLSDMSAHAAAQV